MIYNFYLTKQGLAWYGIMAKKILCPNHIFIFCTKSYNYKYLREIQSNPIQSNSTILRLPSSPLMRKSADINDENQLIIMRKSADYKEKIS